MRCLIAVDGSQGSLAAIRLAGMLLDANCDEVIFYYSPPNVKVRSSAPHHMDVAQRTRQALCDAIFAESVAQLPHVLGDRATRIVGSQSSAAHGILVAAAESQADFIAVGARGLGPMKSLLLGSVSQRVAAESHLPVLIARGNLPPSNDNLRVLLACASASVEHSAVEFLHRLHWPSESRGTALTVVETAFGSELPAWLEQQARNEETELLARAWVEDHSREMVAQRETLTTLCSQLPKPFQQLEVQVVEGHPAECILRVASETACELLVLGTHHTRPLVRLLLGSTAVKVLSHAPCSVLLLPHHETP